MDMTGFRFRPPDADIIGFYLKRLLTVGPPLPSMVRDFIREIDIFGEAPPWEIAAQLPESRRDDFYIFTNLKKRSANRNVRTAENGKGTWKGQSTRKTITVGLSSGDVAVVVGEKKTFSFMADDSTNGKKWICSHWNMTEYSIVKMDGRIIGDEGCYVICHVTHNNNRSSGKALTAKRKAGLQGVSYDQLLHNKINRARHHLTQNLQQLSPQPPPALTVVMTPPPTCDAAEFGGFLESNLLDPEPLSSPGGADQHHQLSSSAATALQQEEEAQNDKQSASLGGFGDADVGCGDQDHQLCVSGDAYVGFGDQDHQLSVAVDPCLGFGDQDHLLSLFEDACVAFGDQDNQLSFSGDVCVGFGDQDHRLSLSGDASMGSDKLDNNEAAGFNSPVDPPVQSSDSSADCSYEYLCYDPATTVEDELDCLKQHGLTFFADDAAAFN